MRFVQFEINGPVCTITMNRPDKRNAVHRPMAEELRDAFCALSAMKHFVLQC
jgi:enoyl-CoA hydratase